MHRTSRLYTDDFEHDRRLVRAPIQDVGIKVDLDVEGLFVFTERLCTKLCTIVMVCTTVQGVYGGAGTFEKSETNVFLASSESSWNRGGFSVVCTR
jgi:hypothetical protein